MPRTSLIPLLACLAAPLRASTLEEVLASMDKASAAFHEMSASMKRTDFTAIINDTSDETGSVRMQRSGSSVRMLIEFTEPDPRTVSFEDHKAEVYYPKIQTVQIYDLGKYRDLVDQFLLLGFGTSGRDLRKNYSLKAAETSKIGDEEATRLELVPKSAAALEHLKKVELWVSPAGYPLQQKFHRPSGDYTLITYSGLRINPNLAADALRLHLPPGVKREYPQK